MNQNNPEEGILFTKGLSKNFGGLAAIEDINIAIKQRSITGIIGPNGSGKTTLFNVITGYLKATRGDVFYSGERITGTKPHDIVNKGIARTFQVPQCCKLLTIGENIRLACLRRYAGGAIQQKMIEFSRIAKIDPFLNLITTNVPIGYLRRTEIAIALATNPKLLLLDEPFSGLTDVECLELSNIIKELHGKIALVIIDHKLKHLMQIVERVVVLNEGRIFFEGIPEEVSKNPEVERIYIGGEIN